MSDEQARRHVRMFKPQFAPLVESGVKCQSVRSRPKRMPRAGEPISLREWTGKPYRSKQRVLRESVITEVSSVDITETGIAVNSYAEPCDDFARADGFHDFCELRDWFKTTHGLPFEGVVIKWHNAKAHTPDGPGCWHVVWSNGEAETVEVFEESGKLFWRTPSAYKTDSYPVRSGWMAKWRRV